MGILAAAILAIAGGLTGILLLSGDGHLLILEKLLGVSEQPVNFLFFAVVLHIGNLLAVLICCRGRVRLLTRELAGMLHAGKRAKRARKHAGIERRELILLLTALVPMLLSLAFVGPVRRIYESEQRLLWGGIGLACSGGVLFLCERFYRGNRDARTVTLFDALLIGLAQAFSVFPGLSRAALTVGTGVLRGIKRSYAVSFSFLLSVPVILAALIAVLISPGGAGQLPSVWICLFSVAVSTGASVFALRLLERIAEYGRFDNLAYFCWGAGILSVVLALIT